MLKLSVSFSKKVPGSAEYSSDGFLCALESEVSDSALNNPNELRQRMLYLWSEARRSVEDQISGNGNGRAPVHAAAPAPVEPSPAPKATPKNGAGPATSKQIKYVISLCQRENRMSIADLKAYLKQAVGVEDPHKLSKAQASTVIEALVGKGGKA